MKWLPMETAPRDGSPVVLLYDDRSGVVGARYGRADKETEDGPVYGWFYLDWSEEIGSGLRPGGDENNTERDEDFIGWFAIPEVKS